LSQERVESVTSYYEWCLMYNMYSFNTSKVVEANALVGVSCGTYSSTFGLIKNKLKKYSPSKYLIQLLGESAFILRQYSI